MYRKDYEAVAEALKDIRRRGKGARPKGQFALGARWAVESIADELAYMYEQDNPDFSRTKFMDAVYKD